MALLIGKQTVILNIPEIHSATLCMLAVIKLKFCDYIGECDTGEEMAGNM
jgi:hypothetical protein